MYDLELIKELEENSIWLEENLDRIKKNHTNKFIAIKNKSIILVNKDLNVLLKTLKGRKEDPNNLLIEFIHSEDTKLIL